MKPDPISKRMVCFLMSFVYGLVCQIWRRGKRMLSRDVQGTCVALCYHSVRPAQRERFARQMDMLLRWAKPIRADTKEPLERGQHHAAVVFHDGFANVVENAMPELACRNIPVTVFVPSGQLGQLPGWIMEPQNRDVGERLIGVEELKSLNKDLVCVASHTRTHPNLLLIGDEDAREEIVKSKGELEAILGWPVRLFGFPYGEHNEALVQMCREAGYERVFTMIPTNAFLESSEFVTGSVDVSPEDWMVEFKLKLLGAYCWLPVAFLLKRKLKLIGRRYLDRVIASEPSG